MPVRRHERFQRTAKGSVRRGTFSSPSEFVRETNNGAPPEDVDAYAGTWKRLDLRQFAVVAIAHYRFSSFSGDDPNTTSNRKAFDPLFYGITLARGLGTWYQG
ncbi:MAG: hypothetical protein KIT00_02295 [Rhodospirillales bacterium]|nr:hypothetical protein [Rhodospirillales bacterium]